MDKYREGADVAAAQCVEPQWKEALAHLQGSEQMPDRLQAALTDSDEVGDVRYHINLRESRLRDRLVLDLVTDRLRPYELPDGDPAGLPPVDQEVVGLLFGAHGEGRGRGYHAPEEALSRCSVRPSLYSVVLPKLADTARLHADLALPGTRPEGPLRFLGCEPFSFRLEVQKGAGSRYRMSGVFHRARRRFELDSAKLLLSDGLGLVEDELFVVRTDGHLKWALRLQRHGPIEFPESAKDNFLLELARMADLPPLSLPESLHWSQVSAPPQARIVFSFEAEEAEEGVGVATAIDPYVEGRVLFGYGDVLVPVGAREAAVVDETGRRILRRDLPAEREHLDRLKPLGLVAHLGGASELRIPRKEIAEVIRALVDAGWSVEADGIPVRAQGTMRARVKSGIDWFDLEATFDYGDGALAKLPELLRAAASGRAWARLSDGSRGLIPEWVRRYSALARFGKNVGGQLRFLPSQAGVIDALLAGQDAADADVEFERLREQLASAANDDGGVVEPPGFKGKLRDYQATGVGWMQFLGRHSYGGCLADDMGLGKTVQVLCVLQGRHPPGATGRRPPSLVVVPKSLVHNWVSEAAKFTELKVLDFTGARRSSDPFEDYDLVVTTYGTLRTEILRFTEGRFTSLVLDEAQAIKNPRSQAAKACRLVQADHRLAISGTPIENGLEELWSLFEFLNPGMLGGLGDFAAPGRDKDDEWLGAVSRALKPFMLRREKSQVLHELPPKTIQVWDIPLGEEEKRRYEELAQYYRRALRGVLQEGGLDKARIHVLEALLRLRQAACHPGLIDPSQLDAGSAKIDALFDKLGQIVPRGHKVLIFSQFTTLLEIVRRRLARETIGYAYLDGGTADRRKTVSQFTDNEDCAVFLISLKAGGCGLNLTQSDYVFILDPWWNPAIEAQAIDRAHRMGQKNRVFAYKMVAEDTVEKKIVDLQSEKRRLADAIVTADVGPLTSLNAEDLAALLTTT